MSFSPLISSVRFKWRLMSQFMHHRQLIFIAAGTRPCWGVMVDIFFVFFCFLGWRGYLLFERQRYSHGTTQLISQKDGCWLPVEGPSHPASLSLFFFLLIAPKSSLAFSFSHLHSNRFLRVSRPVCFAVCLSLNADFLSWFLIQQSGSNRKGKGVMRRCIHTTTSRAFSLCCHEWHKKTASIHLNVGFYSYCWCPYPQDMRQCSGGLHFVGAWLDLFCTWVNNCFTWDIKHGRVLFNSCTPPLGDPPCELISAIWSRWGHTIDPVLKAAIHSLHISGWLHEAMSCLIKFAHPGILC